MPPPASASQAFLATAEVVSSPLLRRDQSLTNIMSFLPQSIWLSPWSAQPASNSYTVDNLDTKVYREAARPNSSARLQVHGRNVAEMASLLEAKLAIAAGQNDFTEVLSPVRDFQM
jgi:hypothetical protein